MDNYSIDDLAREHGMDESDFSFYDDSGLGFVSQDFNPNITNCGKPSPSFYDEDIDEYENEQCMHLILVLIMSLIMSRLCQWRYFPSSWLSKPNSRSRSRSICGGRSKRHSELRRSQCNRIKPFACQSSWTIRRSRFICKICTADEPAIKATEGTERSICQA